jgi:hypothetical protein
MRDRPVTGILSLRQHTATYLSDVASLTKEVVSLINGGGFFAVLFALRRLRSRRHLWLNLTMLLFLGASFILYYLSTSAVPQTTNKERSPGTWWGLLSRLICLVLGTYGIILSRRSQPAPVPAPPTSP